MVPNGQIAINSLNMAHVHVWSHVTHIAMFGHC